MSAHPRRMILSAAAVAVFALLALVAFAAKPDNPRAATAPPTPAGLTAIALDGSVKLAWKASEGATGYAVLRGTSPGSMTQIVPPASQPTTTFTDTTAANGTTYYYAVQASSPDGSSPSGQIARATPRARSCSSGNAIVVENCFPGTTNWKSVGASPGYPDGIEGFLSASSVDAGGSVDLRVSTGGEIPYRIEIYRTGYYGGSQGRLVSMIQGRVSQQGFCFREPSTTGIVDCSEWEATTTITTTQDWVSGVYLLKLVREDNGNYNDALLVVRDDGNTSDVVYGVPTSSYQAYNVFFGKSLYDSWSDGPTTISGANRAVKASFDRPYTQPSSPPQAHDWYTRTDVAVVGWLEQQGYATTYIASEDFHANGAQLQDHRVFISGSHDEYWSQQMFDAAIAARNAGTSLVFLGANAVYWKVRFEPSPITGAPNRVMVGYKTIQSGPADPVAPTSTWRDPAGPNRPENELIGQLYVGENLAQDFPLRVSAAEGRHRLWRYSGLGEQASGTFTPIGSAIVGWEWDARLANGREPAGVETVSSTPVTGQLIQNNGQFQSFGNTTANATIYQAASGAKVFSTGTNNWWRGLGRNVHDAGEPDNRIKQAMVNVLADMDARPTTLASGLTVDALGDPVLTGRTPAPGASSVQPDATVRATFDRELEPASVGAGDLTVTDSGGASVPGTVTLDNPTKSIIFTPTDPLEPFTMYTAHLGTGVRSWHGDSPSAAVQWSFTTGPGLPPKVLERTPAPAAVGVFTDTSVRARFDRKLDPATVTTATFTLRPTAGGANVAASVDYDAATRTVRLVPNQRLNQSTQYTATLNGILANDGTAMTAPVTWSFTTGINLAVLGRTPATSATGISPAAVARVTFSRAADASTVTGAQMRLSGPGGQVAATVSYDPVTLTATLTPNAPLALSTTYTVNVDGGIRAADGAPLDPASWSFTTAASPPPQPSVTGYTPLAGGTGISNGTTVKATFDHALDPATVTPQTFTLAPTAGGANVAATVTYDAAARRATLTPLSGLQLNTQYTATLTTGLRTSTGAPLTSAVTWSFSTADCPCSLMTGVTPVQTGLPVQDFRPGPGPFSYELGTKVTVSEPTQLIALRFYKDPAETGTHVGRVWNGSGTQIASVTYQNETGSGWQRQSLASPVTLQPGQTYTVSVGLNAFYTKTVGGLANQLSSGPISTVANGTNGVFNQVKGSFPNDTWGSSNYFADVVVKLPSSPAHVPQVVSQTPSAGATGVAPGATVSARFNYSLAPSTVTASSFTLTDQSGHAVAGTVGYDEDTRTATFTPADALDTGTAYTARLTTAIRSDDDSALAAPVVWTFATIPPVPPTVVQTSPVAGATDVSRHVTVTAKFSQPMDPATINGSTVTLRGPGGASVPAGVSYNALTRSAELVPSASLTPSSTYTARVSTGVESGHDMPMDAPLEWSFTTSTCPCSLFNGAGTPEFTNLDTANGRGGAGPYSLEMGVKLRVTQPAELEGIRFYKATDETGTHVGRLWTGSGQLVASVTFTGESASGWQEQSFASPVDLAPGQTYVVSVGFNSRFNMTRYVFGSQITSGPLQSVVDGQNGIFSDAGGVFPTQSWGDSNYWVDGVVG